MDKLSTTEKLIGLGNEDESQKDVAFTQRLNDFKDTFGTPHGRRTLLAIIENTFQHESPFTGNSTTYWNIGALDFGRAILDVVAIADPLTYQWFHSQRSNKLIERYEDRLINDASHSPNDT